MQVSVTEPTPKLYSQNLHLICLYNSFMVYTYLSLPKPLHQIDEIKQLLMLSLFVQVKPHDTFLLQNSHNEQQRMSAAFSPPCLPAGEPPLHTYTYNIHAMSENEDSRSGHLKKKKLANHRLSLVLMKGNNSLTCAKTVQKQPFLMSDTYCP